jgi:hypothetical protein
MLVDTHDFAIRFAADDFVFERGACDPDYGEPEGWRSGSI